MKIAITGTRGIPNQYGGFEHFAESLSIKLVQMGHEVWVYNPVYHPIKEPLYRGVTIVYKKSLESLVGSAGHYIFDLQCMKNAIYRKVDIILECGYASAAPWYPFLKRRKTVLITHMDGMEWMRKKWGNVTRKLIHLAEKMAVRYSDSIVCDHPVIADYYREQYSVNPEIITFGARIREKYEEGILHEAGFEPGTYCLLVARLEPENNIRMVIEGFLNAGMKESLVIVGNHSGIYAHSIFKDYKGNKQLVFTGGIYDEKLLDHLRHFSKVVLHGHSVGGTNPSLLEAMAAGSLIIAHDNPYNRWVLGENAGYFNSAGELSILLSEIERIRSYSQPLIDRNLERIRKDFQWDSVVKRYEMLFSNLTGTAG